LRGNEQFDAAWDPRLTANQASSLESKDHLVDRGRADTEVALHVGFGKTLPPGATRSA